MPSLPALLSARRALLSQGWLKAACMVMCGSFYLHAFCRSMPGLDIKRCILLFIGFPACYRVLALTWQRWRM